MKTLASVIVVASSLLASGMAHSDTITPSANFTLRAFGNAGPVAEMDDQWGDGGFQGYITNADFQQVDRTYVEYSLAGLTGPVPMATLDFYISGSGDDTVTVTTYAADGVASENDWYTLATPFTTFHPASGHFSLDVTSVINANLSSGFIGFAFSIDQHPEQAFLDLDTPPVITAVPEPASMALVLAGLATTGWAARRSRRA